MGHVLTLLRRDLAPPARTLVDVFSETVQSFPDAPALDNGAQVLTYTEFAEAAAEVAVSLRAMGVGRGDRVGVRIRSGTLDLYVAIMGILTAGAAYVPVDADDPEERARLVFDEADVSGIIGDDLAISWRTATGEPRQARPPDRPPRPTTPGSSSRPARPAPRRASPSPIGRPPPSSTPRLGCSSGRRRSGMATGSWPASRSPSTRPARRCGSPGGMALAWCPCRARWCAVGWTSDRGWWPTTSRRCRPCPRWLPCGRRRRCPTYAC